MKKCVVIHPLLFAVFPILSLFSHNVSSTSPVEIIRPIVIMVLVASALWLLLTLVVKDKRKAGIIVSTLLFLFFSYGYFFEALRGWTIAGITIGRCRYLLLLYAVVLVAVGHILARTRKELYQLTTGLNIVAIFLVAVPGSMAAYRVATRPRLGIDGQMQIHKTMKPRMREELPDIYYIILDGYGRSDVLRKLYQYDNRPFLDYLAEKGFYIASHSRANYCQTSLSLSSSLNFKYLNDLVSHIEVNCNDRRPLTEMIRNNTVASFLRQYGYVFVAFSSNYHGTEIPNADVYLAPPWGCPTEFETALLGTTLIRPIEFILASSPLQYTCRRKRLLFIFDQLGNMTEMDSPIFVFAHILAPHPPFIFGEHGEPIYHHGELPRGDGSRFMEAGTREEYVRDYPRQLSFVNQKVKQAINKILSTSQNPCIIILQGDHGPGSMLDWEDPNNTNFRERLSILNAYYLPGGDWQELYEGITPVNTFRVILNRYFGTDYQLLKDISYFSTWSHPYKFIDVTDAVIGTHIVAH